MEAVILRWIGDDERGTSQDAHLGGRIVWKRIGYGACLLSMSKLLDRKIDGTCILGQTVVCLIK